MSSNVYYCSLCRNDKKYCAFRDLFKHIQYFHNGQSNFNVRCELSPLCNQVYGTFAGYKSHIYREHRDLIDTSSDKNAGALYLKILDGGTSVSANDRVQVDLDIQVHEDLEQTESDNEIDDENLVFSQVLNQMKIDSSTKRIDLEFFEKCYIHFLLKLREGHSLPQNIIDTITSGFKSLIETIDELIKIKGRNSLTKHQKKPMHAVTEDWISCRDVNTVISNVVEKIVDITKSEYHFMKLCRKHFSYTSPTEIKLENANEVAYYTPIQSSIQRMLNKHDVLSMLLKNLNNYVTCNSTDLDLMFNYRHGLDAQQHPVLKNKPNALLFQLYIDEIGLTNPIGAKKDTQKITMVYFQLEDLPETVKSMLNSIELVGMCHSKYLCNKLNRKKFFDLIVQDLNLLQTAGVFIPILNDHLYFAFTVLVGDHLASNDIGGFQKCFNTGEFCRHCHINYDDRLIPLHRISHPCRTKDQHDQIVQQVISSKNNLTLHGITDASPLINLIGFHPTVSLPNDPMHDFNEGNLCE